MGTLLIKNGLVISDKGVSETDVYIVDGQIAKIKKGFQPVGDHTIKTIDAKGKYILPGAIDPHVHMHLRTAAGYSSDDFFSGSKAALAGGTTTIIDFVTPENRHQSLIEALEQRNQEASVCLCNYAFHMSPLVWNNLVDREMEQCVNLYGISSFKVYLAYLSSIGLTVNELAPIMKKVNALGATLLVHAETGPEIETLQHQFLKKGITDCKAHYLSRPGYTEYQAVEQVINLVRETGAKTYFVHLTTSESVDLIRKAKSDGLPVYGETCPHYLIFNQAVLDHDFETSAPFVLSPPFREQIHVDALWEALKYGILSTVATDHCPFLLHGQKDQGRSDFTRIANGAGSIEYRLSLLYTFGVKTGKISLQQWISLCATQPARIFGLLRKGEIKEGFDADLVIWDPSSEYVISEETQVQNCDHTIYKNLTLRGKAEQVFIGGELAYSATNGFWHRSGSFIKR